MLAAAISVLHEYGIVDVTDDAIEQPVLPPAPERLNGEADEEFAARVVAWKATCTSLIGDFRTKYDRACETGDWSTLLIDGRSPTVFRVRQIPMATWDAFRRVMGTIGDAEQMTLAFRLGVVKIENLSLGIDATKRGAYVGRDGSKERLLDVLSEDVPNRIALAEGGRDVVHRIGLAIMKQRAAPLGK